MKRFISILILLVALLLPAHAFGWVMDFVQEDSLSIDTFHVSDDDDVDTSKTLSFADIGLNDLHFQVCMYSDSIECVVWFQQNIWPDTTWEAYHWETVDSIIFTGLSAVTCSLWTPVCDVPPEECRLLVVGRANNKISTGGAYGGTAAIISYFREERDAD